MGGVGKTTLLKKLNNKFLNTPHDFDVVIWVEISREMNLKNVQDVIRKRFKIADDEGQTLEENDRAGEISTKLSSKKFALLLDDVWERIDLNRVGVPLPNDQNRSKIILTTRSEEACSYPMVAYKTYKVECLSEAAAWDLFRQIVTEDVLNSNPLIPGLAETVAKECERLLVTVGSAMRNRKSPESWQSAINTLRTYPSKFTGMGDLVFPKLKFSFDSLTDDIHKSCFLSCSMFPEDHRIRKDDLIELWVAERVLNNNDNLDAARNQGQDIIESLKVACLLEGVEGSDHHIKIHDILRNLALYLSSENENEILVCENDGLIKEHGIARWQKTVKLSLWGSSIDALSKIPYCPRLQTFLARNTQMETFPKAFFRSMPALNVLDLQSNESLSKLPREVSKLIQLQYLNLSNSNIKELPKDIKKLKQLRILFLDGTDELEALPQGVISSLSALQVFSRVSTSYKVLRFQKFWDTVLLQELERLEHIKEIGLTLFTSESAHRFKSSDKLRSCVTRLIVDYLDLLPLDISLSTKSPTLNFQNLHDIFIKNCPVRDLTCLIHAPRLRFVSADSCPSLEEIIACDIGSSAVGENRIKFERLKQLNFRNLVYLKSICRQIICFPSLESIYVQRCPKLRKLPLKCDELDGKTNISTSIMGNKYWWNQLEWEDEATKHVFSSKFLPVDDYRRPIYTYEATVTHSPPLPVDGPVDIDSKVTEVWKLIEDGSISIIGLLGMGGVGKTTLLKELFDKLMHAAADEFDVVIWALVSHLMNLERVQNVIRKKLEIPDDKWETLTENSRATEIHTRLNGKKFVLFLDDLWEPIDLIKVGIPLPNDQNRAKIILTTRSEEVCRRMCADRGIYIVGP